GDEVRLAVHREALDLEPVVAQAGKGLSPLLNEGDDPVTASAKALHQVGHLLLAPSPALLGADVEGRERPRHRAESIRGRAGLSGGRNRRRGAPVASVLSPRERQRPMNGDSPHVAPEPTSPAMAPGSGSPAGSAGRKL